MIEEQNIGLDDRVYIISVEQIYRTNESARKALKDGKLYSYGSSASCGVDDLNVNHTYIVTGEVSNGKTQIGGCDFHCWSWLVINSDRNLKVHISVDQYIIHSK